MTSLGLKIWQNPFFKRFRSNQPAVYSLCILLVVLFVSSFASFIANDKPIVLSYKGQIYFPAVVKYLPAEFGQEGFVTDYFRIEEYLRENGWLIFPPIKHRPYDQNLNFDKLPAPPGSCSQIERLGTSPMTLCHWIGTDTGGVDLLTRLIYACRTSLLMAISITLLSLLLGVSLGAIMGYIGGFFDLLVGRFLETIGYFPVLFLLIILVAFLENPSITMMVAIFSILGLSPFAFYMRGQVLKVRKLTFIEAASAIGQTHGKIIFSHVLPNALGPVVVLVPFTITSNIAFLATVDFLGFGVQPPTASLGALLRSGYDNMADRWWLVASAAGVLVLILLLVNFIGDGVRNGLDPKSLITKKKILQLEEKENLRIQALYRQAGKSIPQEHA